jgi:hypothetical protein
MKVFAEKYKTRMPGTKIFAYRYKTELRARKKAARESQRHAGERRYLYVVVKDDGGYYRVVEAEWIARPHVKFIYCG